MGFYFSMPLQIFNKNQGEIARAQRERSQADAKVAALQASVNLEVAQAYRQYTTARNLLESTEGDLLQRARSVRDTTEYAYQRGEASLIEFLDAQRAFNDATQTYNDARASYARSLYQLDAASGAAVSAI
jgi:cobalt-zinc-cadmium efflux system outer membrane protein